MDDSAVVGHKRTRTGETFIDPSEVTLHCHDFSFDRLRAAAIAPTPEDKGPRNAATPAGKRGFHADPSAVVADADTAKNTDEKGAKVAADKDDFVYYGAVPWVRSEGAVSEDLPSFDALHEAYAGACSTLLESALAGGKKSDEGHNEQKKAMPTVVSASAAAVSPWERHYELTTNNFFPIKNYIHRAFPTLLEGSSSASSGGDSSANGDQSATAKTAPRRLVMEVGCGNGSAILTFLKHCPHDDYVCFDISATAVRLLTDHAITRAFVAAREEEEKGHTEEDSVASRPPPITTFVYDICDKVNELDEAFVAARATEMKQAKVMTSSSSPPLALSPPYRRNTVDQMLLIFVLCALPTVPDMLLAIRRMAYWLRPGAFVEVADGDGKEKREWVGGRLLFRDYAILDHNMLRFLERPAPTTGGKTSAAAKAAVAAAATAPALPPTSPFFLKGDGTSQFFFERSFTERLFGACGLVPIDVSYHCNEVRNRKNGKVMRKVFINAEFGLPKAQ